MNPYIARYWYERYLSLQDGRTALFFAAGVGDPDIVKILVDYGAAVDIRYKVYT